MKPVSLLIVEDDALLAQAYKVFLNKMPLEVEIVGTLAASLERFDQLQPDIILLDLLLPDGHGIELLRYAKNINPDTVVVVVTTESSSESTRESILSGAEDYLVKPLNQERLITTVQNVLEMIRLKSALSEIQSALPSSPISTIIGQSPRMQALYQIISNAARCDASVFITGESGTGKELCAEAIHRLSARSDRPLIARNCAAIPKDLVESEIFGHCKGAFTGATKDRRGAASLAHGGTLFLDEICDLDYDLQAKFLRFLQSGKYQPLGSSEELTMDARIICATNKNPMEQVRLNRFREDLFYRLYVLPIEMPPLRERDGDITLLAEYFLQKFTVEYQGDEAATLSPQAMEQLNRYAWPGNVRQLENVIQSLVAQNPSQQISGNSVEELLRRMDLNLDNFISRQRDNRRRADSVQNRQIRPLWEEERDIIERAILLCEGNIQQAAEQLHIDSSTIYRKRKRWIETTH
jgi:two-component system, repressor protein LuxO